MARQLTAAAARYTRKPSRNTITPTSVSGQGWQEEAWRFFDSVPEVRFAATWIGNAMSGARLFAGRRAEDGTIEPAPDGHIAAELVARIAGGPDGQSQLLGAFGPHLVAPGEGWIVIRPTLDTVGLVNGEEWRVLSTAEVKPNNGDMTAEIDGETIKIPEYDPDAPDDTAPSLFASGSPTRAATSRQTAPSAPPSCCWRSSSSSTPPSRPSPAPASLAAACSSCPRGCASPRSPVSPTPRTT